MGHFPNPLQRLRSGFRCLLRLAGSRDKDNLHPVPGWETARTKAARHAACSRTCNHGEAKMPREFSPWRILETALQSGAMWYIANAHATRRRSGGERARSSLCISNRMEQSKMLVLRRRLPYCRMTGAAKGWICCRVLDGARMKPIMAGVSTRTWRDSATTAALRGRSMANHGICHCPARSSSFYTAHASCRLKGSLCASSEVRQRSLTRIVGSRRGNQEGKASPSPTCYVFRPCN